MPHDPDFTVRIVDANGDPDHTVAVVDGISDLSPSVGDLLAWNGSAWVDRALVDGDIPAAIARDSEVAAAVALLATKAAVNALLPSGAIAQTTSRYQALTNQVALTSARLQLYAVYLAAGQTVTSITFVSGTQAAVNPVNQHFSLYSSALAKLAATADDTSTAWNANSPKTLALSPAYLVPTSGLYYVGIVMKADTAISFAGTGSTNAATAGIAPIIGGFANTGLTDPASLPNPATGFTASASLAYAYVS